MHIVKLCLYMLLEYKVSFNVTICSEHGIFHHLIKGGNTEHHSDMKKTQGVAEIGFNVIKYNVYIQSCFLS